MNNTYYDIIVVSLSAVVAGIYIYSASREINRSMRELNEHNRTKKMVQKNSSVAVKIGEPEEMNF